MLHILATWHADHLTVLVCPHVPAAVCSVDTVLTVWQVVYLGLAVLLKSGREVQAELQAAYWEDLSLKIILRGCTAGSVSTWHTPLVISSLGMVSLCCMAIKYRSSRKCLILCLVFLLSILAGTRHVRPDTVSQLSWSDYQTGCLADRLAAGDQATCHHFTGLTVQWTGLVERVKIVERSNYVEMVVSSLPDVVRRKTNIKCLIGDKFGSCESKTSQVAKLLCKTRTQPDLEDDQKCHLERYSSYTYTIELKMPGPMFGTAKTVVLTVEDLHRQTVLSLQSGQKVQATGKLVTRLGREEVEIEVQEISLERE